jgi:carboxymethylenebutenolidase
VANVRKRALASILAVRFGQISKSSRQNEFALKDSITLTALDGHSLEVCFATPAEKPKAVVVVVQQIIGVNTHIKEVADRFALAGYLVTAPALFDRIAPNITLAYDGDGIDEGRGLKDQADANSEFDVKAAIDHVASAGAIAVVGFCWGGSLAWRMACDKASGLTAAMCYYGGELPSLVGRDAACPVMVHFGIHDASIPEVGARSFATAQPSVETHFYDAGQGLNCDHRGQCDVDAAAMAWGRTMAFLETHLA